jgi:hypothetical protein
MSDEIGRQLLASDLQERTIVVIKPPGPDNHGLFFTMWVQSIEPDFVVFYSALRHWSVISFKTPDDGLVDDRDRAIEVFEYLGDP